MYNNHRMFARCERHTYIYYVDNRKNIMTHKIILCFLELAQFFVPNCSTRCNV